MGNSDESLLAPAKIEAQQSRIHGLGIFAARDIACGEVLIEWANCTEVLTVDNVEKLSQEERKRVSFIDGQYILFKPPACWVNHSCKANAKGADGCDVAVRTIKKGEEITVDYVAEKVPGLNLQCTCGSDRCRGFLCVPAQG